MNKITLLEKQLSRMRSMNNFYHKQFLLDVRIFFLSSIFLIYLSIKTIEVNYLLNITSIFGSVFLSFHAYYLIFSRNFTEYLEKEINKTFGENVLIAHILENSYIFPIQDKKIVVAKLGKEFSWFGFVTLFITLLGVIQYFYSLFVIYKNINNLFFVIFSLLILLITFTTGYWWFVKKTGEKRLKEIYKNGFN